MAAKQKSTLQCDSCRTARTCGDQAELQRRLFFAFQYPGAPRLECPDYEPRWYRGIEGVIDDHRRIA